MTSALDIVRRGISVVPIAITLCFSAAVAQDENCTRCHDEVPAASEAHPDLACADCHAGVTREHRRKGLEPIGDEVCSDCHRKAGREISRSVHDGNASCLDCHGAPHELTKGSTGASPVSSINQVQSCGKCHDDPPGLIDDYIASVHGIGLFRSGLAASASCSDCHGAHKIEPVDKESAPTTRAHAPEMCGQCHSLLLDEWKAGSAHGIAWATGDSEAPVCTDCHASHEIIEPTSAQNRLAYANNCGECHGEYMTTFRDSFHGKANELGFVEGAACADCHTPHNNLPASDPRSSVHPDRLLDTCGACHRGITVSMLSYEPHIDPANPEDHFYVHVVWVFMVGLLIAVFAFFGIHDSLWLQRTLVASLRGEHKALSNQSGRYVKRFSRSNIYIHVIIIITFLLLALTGLPLKFHDTGWAQQLMALLGGVESSTLIHRLAAIGTFGYALYHLGSLFIRWAIRRERGLFWGPNSMVPQPKDIADVFANFRYFLYLGDKPQSDRWNYIEKFDYLAVFWGVMIIGLSGLLLWAPLFFTKFLPGWTINAALVVHSDEALLATGFIFVFHFFHTHLRPESFPMDTSIFTGRLSLERFEAERPLEYRRLVDNGELEQYLVDPPTKDELRRAYIWGTVFVVIGLLLAAGIFWALVTH